MYRQQDKLLTYAELEQRHAISITEHEVWAEVEFERQCCYHGFSHCYFRHLRTTYCAHRKILNVDGLGDVKTKVEEGGNGQFHGELFSVRLD